SPLISQLERQGKHSAILWVIQIVRNLLFEQKPSEIETYLAWLTELEQIVQKEQFTDIPLIEKKGKSIFSSPKVKGTFSVLISRLFGAEGYFRLDKYELYKRFLWDILDQINDHFSSEQIPRYQSIIRQFLTLTA
ncbi:MAG: hypothetical protein AAFY76_26880, partial [Cyanobacteria bacterium J06649_11]